MRTFNDLSIADLIIGLTDLLAETTTEGRPLRVTALALVDGDRIYRGQLAQLLAGLAALPPGDQELPLRDLLKSADGSFDRDVRILRALADLLALLPAPTATAQAVAAAIVQIAPGGLVQSSYATEALHAKTVAAALDPQRAALEAVALPDAQTPTALAVVERMVAAGLELDRLGSSRGETVATRGDRGASGQLRSKAIGALHALRDHVARATEARADLPADLDGKIFGYLDELQRLALGRSAGAEPAKPVTPVTPAPVVAPTA